MPDVGDVELRLDGAALRCMVSVIDEVKCCYVVAIL